MKRFNEQHFVEETLQHLSWNENTDKICKKITSGIGAVRLLRDFVDKDTLLSVYFALAHCSTEFIRLEHFRGSMENKTRQN